jgi:asparagine synthase (glutamine-hydrolysing)
MLPHLARRGPDAEGIVTWPGVAFGHRRSAILDLSQLGNQPMVSDDRNIGLVFNGCIYNFLELRENLTKCGILFRSECDTKVLLRGYQEWGIDKLVSQCRGMFAFAIWDAPRRTLYLVRDRLGVKPLVYVDKGAEIAFSSTISALRASGAGGRMDPDAVQEFLEFGYVTDERSIYRDVKKLPPATILEWKEGQAARDAPRECVSRRVGALHSRGTLRRFAACVSGARWPGHSCRCGLGRQSIRGVPEPGILALFDVSGDDR